MSSVLECPESKELLEQKVSALWEGAKQRHRQDGLSVEDAYAIFLNKVLKLAEARQCIQKVSVTAWLFRKKFDIRSFQRSVKQVMPDHFDPAKEFTT